MNRAVGALADCACSTSWMMREMVLSEAVFSTLTWRTPSTLIEPANTLSPVVFERGTDSPVMGDSSRLEVPCRICPSAGTRSPGRTRTRSFTRNADAGTVRWPSFESRRTAVFGTSDARAFMPARALPAATLSSSSPTANRNTTAAASSASPITRAPIEATTISVSMEKGEPEVASANALRAKGMTPAMTAAAKIHSA